MCALSVLTAFLPLSRQSLAVNNVVLRHCSNLWSASERRQGAQTVDRQASIYIQSVPQPRINLGDPAIYPEMAIRGEPRGKAAGKTFHPIQRSSYLKNGKLGESRVGSTIQQGLAEGS